MVYRKEREREMGEGRGGREKGEGREGGKERGGGFLGNDPALIVHMRSTKS